MIKLTELHDRPADVEAFDAHHMGAPARTVPGPERIAVTRSVAA